MPSLGFAAIFHNPETGTDYTVRFTMAGGKPLLFADDFVPLLFSSSEDSRHAVKKCLSKTAFAAGSPEAGEECVISSANACRLLEQAAAGQTAAAFGEWLAEVDAAFGGGCIAAAEEDESSLANQINELQEAIDELESEKDELETQLIILEQEKEELEEEKDQMEWEKDELEYERDQLAERVEELESERDELADRVSSLTAKRIPGAR